LIPAVCSSTPDTLRKESTSEPSRRESVSLLWIALTSVLFPADELPITNTMVVACNGLRCLAARQALKSDPLKLGVAVPMLCLENKNSSVFLPAQSSGVWPYLS